MKQRSQLNFLAAVVLFLISGCTSLVYETVWIRILSLVVGSTAAAVGITLAIFFTGLAIGGALSGKISSLSSSSRTSFKIYACLEAVIGLSSTLALFILLNLNKIVFWFQPSSALDVVLRYGIVTLTLILPTTAMGATLPALISYFSSLPKYKNSQASLVSFLYGINTFGGAVGAILGSYLIIPYAGLLTGTLITCLVNVLLAAFAFLLASLDDFKNFATTNKKSRKAAIVSKQIERDLHDGSFATSNSSFSINQLYAIAAISGFSSITAEVVWNKYLAIFFGTNIFGIGTILGIFLGGLAVGPFILAALSDRIKSSTERVLTVTLFLAAILTSLTSFGLGYAPYVVQWLILKSSFVASHPIPLKASLAVLMIFPTAAIYGILFPLVAMQLTHLQKINAATSTGYTYAVNTIGSVAGSLLAGLWLVPAIGSHATIVVAASLYGLGGLALFFALEGRTFLRKITYASGIAVALITCMIFTKFDFRAMIESSRGYRSSSIPLGQEEFKLILEGQNTVVSLSHDPLDGAVSHDYLRLKTSGLYESIFNVNGSRDLPRYEGLLGLLPWLARSDAQNVFVVGFGAGYTVDLLTSLPIQHVQVVELEKAVVDAFRYAVKGHESYLGRKNLDLSIDDARHVLQKSPEHSFDIVVSQPSHSWLPGSANLFTSEYFELVHSKLRSNGVFAQWLNLYSSNEDALKSILKSFFKTFPNGTVFTGENDDELILLGSDTPIRMDGQTFNNLINSHPSLKHKLANLPMSEFNDVFSFYLADASAFTTDVEQVPFNTDLNAYAEVIQSRAFYTQDAAAQTEMKAFLTRHFDPRFQGLAFNFPRDSESQLKMLENYRQQNQLQKLLKVLPPFLTPNNLTFSQKSRLGVLLRSLELNSHALTISGEVLKQLPSQAALEEHLGVLADLGEFERLLTAYKNQPKKIRSRGADCYAARAALELDLSSASSKAFSKLLMDQFEIYRNSCGSYAGAVFGLIEEKRQDPARALHFFDEYLLTFPRDISALTHALSLSAKLRDTNRLNYYVAQWKVQTAAEQVRLKSVAEMYKTAGYIEDARHLDLAAEYIGKKTIKID